MNEKQVARILEIQETINKFNIIRKQLDEKEAKLKEEREKIELSDVREEVPPNEPKEETVEG